MFGKIIPVRPPTTKHRVKLLEDRIKFLQSQLVKLENMRAQGMLSLDEKNIRSVPINGEIYQLTQLIRSSRIQPPSYDQSSMWWTQRRGETSASARGGYDYSGYTPPSQKAAAAKPAKKYVAESYYKPAVAPVKYKVKRVETDYEKMENGSIKVTKSEFVYLRDGRIVTAYKTEILG